MKYRVTRKSPVLKEEWEEVIEADSLKLDEQWATFFNLDGTEYLLHVAIPSTEITTIRRDDNEEGSEGHNS